MKINHCLFKKQVLNKVSQIARNVGLYGYCELEIYGRTYKYNTDESVDVGDTHCSNWGEAIDKFLTKDVETSLIEQLQVDTSKYYWKTREI